MSRTGFGIIAVLFSSATAFAGPQICALGASAVGQPASVICKDVNTGATTQAAAVGSLATIAGNIGGSLAHHGHAVLVTNQTANAILFSEANGRLVAPTTLQTGGEATLSGAIDDHGAFVLTGTRLLHFAAGHAQPTSSQPLLLGDGSAAQVTLAGGYAYVSEKNGTLSAFLLGANGELHTAPTAAAGVPAGVIVGIAGLDDLVVAPIAHLATNANQATVSVVGASEAIQIVPTKEVAACWTAADADEVCISNPGSSTVSCGNFGPGGFRSYTSAAATVTGQSVNDLDVRDNIVGVLGTQDGAPMLLAFGRSDATGDFLELLHEYSLGVATATGAMILPSLSR
jgi:hypothetical protein